MHHDIIIQKHGNDIKIVTGNHRAQVQLEHQNSFTALDTTSGNVVRVTESDNGLVAEALPDFLF